MKGFRKKGRVSLWVGTSRVDQSVDLLRELAGVGHYDLDDQEVIVDDKKWKEQTVRHLVKQLSYASSFLGDATEAAVKHGVARGLYVVAQFDFAYDPAKVVRTISPSLVFLGHFPWNDDEDEE